MADPERQGRKRGRLSRSGDFDRAYRDGKSKANRHLVLYAFPRPDSDQLRLGISVGKKVGGATVRSRVKRVIREAFWELSEELPQGHDFVVVGRPGVEELAEHEGMDGVKGSLASLLETQPDE